MWQLKAKSAWNGRIERFSLSLFAIRWIPPTDFIDHGGPRDLSTLASGRLGEVGAVELGHLLTEQYQISTAGLGRDLYLTNRLQVVNE